MRYSGKVAFITGGAIGFGRAFARALCAEGAGAVIADIDAEAAERTAAELREQGHAALAVRCDVADENAVQQAVERAAAHFGGIDILINNAGRHLTKYNQPFGTLTGDEIRGLFDVNVIGVVNCTLACKPHLAARRGNVLNIASIAGYQPTSPYGVSKLAVRGLTIAFAQELSADGVRVNAIAPGLMATENALADLPEALVKQFVEQLQMVKRLGQMDDIVAAMLFLCSEEAGFITGETLRVSGGYPQTP
jgi:NAD(P)-dependent dehydrogenase (short-subunit alcohol dehydrogenase family)